MTLLEQFGKDLATVIGDGAIAEVSSNKINITIQGKPFILIEIERTLINVSKNGLLLLRNKGVLHAGDGSSGSLMLMTPAREGLELGSRWVTLRARNGVLELEPISPPTFT